MPAVTIGFFGQSTKPKSTIGAAPLEQFVINYSAKPSVSGQEEISGNASAFQAVGAVTSGSNPAVVSVSIEDLRGR